jgi:hypothetical protein
MKIKPVIYIIIPLLVVLIPVVIKSFEYGNFKNTPEEVYMTTLSDPENPKTTDNIILLRVMDEDDPEGLAIPGLVNSKLSDLSSKETLPTILEPKIPVHVTSTHPELAVRAMMILKRLGVEDVQMLGNDEVFQYTFEPDTTVALHGM